MRVDTKLVKFKSGKFKGNLMRINADQFDPALHEDAPSTSIPKPAEPKRKGKGKE